MADFGDICPGARVNASGEEFEIGNELGRGAAARVFACRRLSDGEQLAVKAIDLRRLRLQEDFDGQIVKLNREINIQQGLDHKRIVNLHTSHRTDSWCLLFMELVGGGELFSEIVQKKCFSEVEARHVFRQILDGVAYMHSRHVIHRDLKPENILIQKKVPAAPPTTGDVYDIKIADFGLSKLISEGMSAAKTLLGTPQYWAPEVLDINRNGGTYDKSADFWCLGVILFVMLGGRYPFDGKKMPLDEQIRTASFNMGTAAWRHVSDEAKDLIRGLLRVDVATRLDMEKCLAHRWLAEPGFALAEPESARVCQGVKVAEVTSAPVGGVQADAAALPVVLRPLVEEPHSTGSSQQSTGQAGRGLGAEQSLIFSLSELLNSQISIAASLEMACLVFRHADPGLAEDIRQTLRQARDLSQHSVTVIGSYAQTAGQVSKAVLPDLQLAIQEKEPALAVNVLGMVKEWVTDMKSDGLDMQARYSKLHDNVNQLIMRAQRSGVSIARELADGVQERDADAPLIAAPHLQPLAIEADAGVSRGPPMLGFVQPDKSQKDFMNNLTQQMSEQFNRLACWSGDTPMLDQPPAGTAQEIVVSNGASVEPWKHDFLELLFMAPGVGVSLLPRMESFTATSPPPTVEPAYSVHSHGSAPVSLAPMDHEIEYCAANGALVASAQGNPSASAVAAASAAESAAAERSAAALMRALRELRRVDKILHSCSAFWTHMDLAVQKLSQMKEHTEQLVKFATSSKPLKDRFDQRLGEYSNFWDYLEQLCRTYCSEYQAASKKMYDFISEVDQASDVIDTRLGMAAFRAGKQSRHKM